MMNPNQPQYGGQYQAPPQPQQKGCLGRNWKWMLPVGCLGLILGLVALVGGIFVFAMSALKSSEVYQGALKIAQTSPAAVGRLGEPIDDGWLVKGNVDLSGDRGSANFDIPLSGPKKSGTLHVLASTQGGEWTYEKLDLAVEGGETVSLLDRGAGRETPEPLLDVEEDSDGTDGETGEEEPAAEGETEAAAAGDGRAVAGGELDGKATSKPEPAYPALAKAARAAGVVSVQVTVDETGRVVAAEATSGHPLLRQAAVEAARGARFSPTLQSGRPVKVSGVLTYNFVLEE